MRGTGDGGAAITEFVAILPIGLVIILVAFEALLAETTVERVENAARTGARLASQEQNAGTCADSAMNAAPSWLDRIQADGGWRGNGLYCHVRAEVPVLFPGAHLDFTIDRTVQMPVG
ncbi:TadE/TadG family type IV pilus assembly protein [Actinoallomurus sp. CA-150999]|uniref:TadE/TadG family type IV pilus assembly protein n=1 Tax=Actinoallomurus sp. CA-150999 TaxID=3239887 RepID=UPI003D9148C5